MRIVLSAAVAALLACTVSINSAAAQTRSLYERLGGYDSIIAVVDETIKNVVADKRINKFFKGANVPRLRRMLADQICVAAGGPCVYVGRDMKSAHAGMGIKSSHFNALVRGPRQGAQEVQGASPRAARAGGAPGADQEGHRRALRASDSEVPAARRVWVCGLRMQGAPQALVRCRRDCGDGVACRASRRPPVYRPLPAVAGAPADRARSRYPPRPRAPCRGRAWQVP